MTEAEAFFVEHYGEKRLAVLSATKRYLEVQMSIEAVQRNLDDLIAKRKDLIAEREDLACELERELCDWCTGKNVINLNRRRRH